MFVVIVCTKCGGSSQVDERALGQAVVCPLCNTETLAEKALIAMPVAKPVQAEPLSLDDATPLPPFQEKKHVVLPQTLPVKRSPVRTAVWSGLSLLATLLLMGGIYGAFHYGDGDIPNRAWETFSPPGGRCSFKTPGEPRGEDIPSEGYAVTGGRRFLVHRWFEKVDLEFGWIDLNADQALEAHFDKVVFDLLRREEKRLNGKLTGEKGMNFSIKGRKFESRRFLMDSDQGKIQLQVYFDADPTQLKSFMKKDIQIKQLFIYVPSAFGVIGAWAPIDFKMQSETRVVEPGQQVRLYFAMARGKKLTDKMAWPERFFNSFSPE